MEKAIAILLLGVLLATVSLLLPRPALSQEPEPLVSDALIAPDDPSITGQAVGPLGQPGYYSTSEFMIGRVAVAIVLPESDGSIDPSTEDWTAEEIAQVEDEVATAFSWWTAREPRAGLEFVYELHVLPTGYEPINHPQTDEGLWIGQVMGQLGYTASSYFTRVRDYSNDLRSQHQADWAFVIFLADSSNDADNCFSDGWFAYAYLGGPFMVMTSGISNVDAMAAHEIGHIFHALDQYFAARQDCTYRSGYFYVENQNSLYNSQGGGCLTNEDSIMRSVGWPYQSGAVDHYARGQIGWWDSDGDDILDPVDTVLDVALNPQDPNPAPEGSFSLTGTVEDIPRDSPNRTDVTINTVTSVSYRLNGGSWMDAVASDGAFDEYMEDYAFVTAHLAPGTYVIDIRASNRFGVVEVLEAAEVLVVVEAPPPTKIYLPIVIK